MENNDKKIISDEEILSLLENRLIEIRKNLKKTDSVEDPGLQADDEDTLEAGEEKDVQHALGNELKEGEMEILGSIKWIKEHGNACAFAGCHNTVSNERRLADPASITCTEHMDEEDQILRDLIMGI